MRLHQRKGEWYSFEVKEEDWVQGQEGSGCVACGEPSSWVLQPTQERFCLKHRLEQKLVYLPKTHEASVEADRKLSERGRYVRKEKKGEIGESSEIGKVKKPGPKAKGDRVKAMMQEALEMSQGSLNLSSEEIAELCDRHNLEVVDFVKAIRTRSKDMMSQMSRNISSSKDSEEAQEVRSLEALEKMIQDRQDGEGGCDEY